MAYIANLPCVSAGKLSVIYLFILRYTFHFVSVLDDQAVRVLIVTKTWQAAVNLLIMEARGKQDVTIRIIHCVGLRLPFQTPISTALISVPEDWTVGENNFTYTFSNSEKQWHVRYVFLHFKNWAEGNFCQVSCCHIFSSHCTHSPSEMHVREACAIRTRFRDTSRGRIMFSI